MGKLVVEILVLEEEIKIFFDEQLKVKIMEFCVCLEQGEILDVLLFEVFVMVREVSSCVMGMCYFDC